MKVNYFLPIAAIFGCYVFGSAAIAQQVCPVGGGACVARVVPASSYSSARAVDVTARPVAGADMPAGGFCGWAVVNQGSSFYSGGPAPYADGVPCQGYPVASLPNGSTTTDCPAGFRSVQTGANGNGDQWFSCLKL